MPSDEEVNDAAVDGGVEVAPGDFLPGIPRHSLRLSAGLQITERWRVDLAGLFSSDRVFFGDEGNDQARLAGYGILNLRSSFALTEHVEIFLRADNLLDKDYATFGALAEIEIELEEAPGAEDPRFLSPGAPRSAWAGLRVRF